MSHNDNIQEKTTNHVDLSTGLKDSDGSSCKVERLEDQAIGSNTEFVDRDTERAVIRKLDWRIIPMIMWVYLMNMMDRGMQDTDRGR